MKVTDLIDSIAHRVGDDVFSENGEPYTLEVMNRIYRNLNSRYHLIDSKSILKAADFADDYSIDIPKNVGTISMIKPYYKYYDPSFFFMADSLENSYTIYGGKIYLKSAPVKDITIWYNSVGKKLVSEINDNTLETDEPQWPDKIVDILFYGTCIELSTTYQHFKMDFEKYRELLSDIEYYGKVRQNLLPPDGIPSKLENEALNNADDYQPN